MDYLVLIHIRYFSADKLHQTSLYLLTVSILYFESIDII
jgi:hypothetical protein